MTFLELCQTTRRECGIQGETQPTTVVGQTGLILKVVNWVAAADLFIQSLHPDWNFLWKEFTGVTVLGSSDVAKPTDFGQWDREAFGIARGTANGRKLTYGEFEDWRKDFSLKTNQEPYKLCIAPNNNLKLFAPADAIHNIYGNYWKAPVVLTNNTDVPAYPDRFHRVIVEKAKMWFFEDIESTQQWQQSEKSFNEWLDKLEDFSLPGQQAASQSSPAPMAVVPA